MSNCNNYILVSLLWQEHDNDAFHFLEGSGWEMCHVDIDQDLIDVCIYKILAI